MVRKGTRRGFTIEPGCCLDRALSAEAIASSASILRISIMPMLPRACTGTYEENHEASAPSESPANRPEPTPPHVRSEAARPGTLWAPPPPWPSRCRRPWGDHGTGDQTPARLDADVSG